MVWGAIAGAAISAGASYLGSKKTNAANRAISAEQMAFQEQMSSTAYQRGMKDMRAAGLNPMLAYSKGGASSPAGAGIPAQNELAGVGASINSGFANAASNTERKKTEKLMTETLIGLERDNRLKWYQGNLLEQQTRNEMSKRPGIFATNDLLELQNATAKAQATQATETDQFFKSDWGKMMKWLDLTGRSINPMTGSINSGARAAGKRN